MTGESAICFKNAINACNRLKISIHQNFNTFNISFIKGNYSAPLDTDSR